MTEPAVIAALKTLGAYTIGPILALFGWIIKRLFTKIDVLENRVSTLDKEQAVQASKLEDIKKDTRNANKKLDRIIERMSEDRRHIPRFNDND